MLPRPDIKPDVHMFICTRLKDGPCCAAKGAAEVRLQLRLWVKEENLNDKVKITASQCLGYCKEGISLCIYPQTKWFLNVTSKNLENLKTEILSLL